MKIYTKIRLNIIEKYILTNLEFIRTYIKRIIVYRYRRIIYNAP